MRNPTSLPGTPHFLDERISAHIRRLCSIPVYNERQESYTLSQCRSMEVIATSQETCPVESALRVIGGKWTLLILRDLMTGPKRFGELRKSLGGVSPKTLSLRLRELEQDAIITRTVFPEVPLRVEYGLTEAGATLSNVIDVLRDWGAQWDLQSAHTPRPALTHNIRH